MKKGFLISLCLLMGTLMTKADIAKSVMLHHNGNVTLYDWDQVQQAVDAAVDGDTIYLAEGTFAAFNVNKRIVVRGSGSATMVEGDCHINISGTEKIASPVLDALSFSGSVEVAQAYRQFTLRKCKMKDLRFTAEEYRDVKMDRCYVFNEMHTTTNLKELNVFNSKIYMLNGYCNKSSNLNFDHCNIMYVTDTIKANFTNSIIAYVGTEGTASASFVRAYLVACTVNNTWTYDATMNKSCIVIDKPSSNNYLGINKSCDYTASNMNNVPVSTLDGTYIGIAGGQHPFTQELELPQVTKHSIAVDAVNKKLNVTLTVDKK